MFNGAPIYLIKDAHVLSQPEHTACLVQVPIDVSKTDFISARSRAAYVISVDRPDLTFSFSFCGQYPFQGPKADEIFKQTLRMAQEHPKHGLLFIKLDLHSAHLPVFSDANFTSNEDYSRQTGFIICLVDSNRDENVLRYSNVRSRRVGRSALAAELSALIHPFDQTITLRMPVNSILNRRVRLTICTDSKSLPECLVRVNETSENALQLTEVFPVRHMNVAKYQRSCGFHRSKILLTLSQRQIRVALCTTFWKMIRFTFLHIEGSID